MKFREKEPEEEEEEKGGERGEEEDDKEEEEEETRPVESSSKSLKKGEACFLTVLYLGCIYEEKLDWVTNTLEEYQYV